MNYRHDLTDGHSLWTSMPVVKKRLGASILLSCLSMVSIILLLPNSVLSNHLQKITVGYGIDDYGKLFRWGTEDELEEEEDVEDDDVRLVVFGDSWADNGVQKGEEARGKSWTDVLCEELLCSKHLNFATSQPTSSWPSQPPTGVLTSNEIYTSAVPTNTHTIADLTHERLPDLSSQIASFLSLPPSRNPTVYVISQGFWDVYHFSTLDLKTVQSTIQQCVEELFAQLDILYNYHLRTTATTFANTSITSHTVFPEFKVILPTTMDPTVSPGWLTHRPVPLAPGNIAEEQKSAVYLTESWNKGVEVRVRQWMADIESLPQVEPEKESGGAQEEDVPEEVPDENHTEALAARRLSRARPSKFSQFKETGTTKTNKEIAESTGGGMGGKQAKETPKEKVKQSKTEDETKTEHKKPQTLINPVSKMVYTFDIQETILNEMVEHSMEVLGISDAHGMGKGKSSFSSVYFPCVHTLEDYEQMDLGEKELVTGLVQCAKAEEWLWWDAWSLGSVVKRRIGWGIGSVIKDEKGLRETMS